MSSLQLNLQDGRTAFTPGETLRGTATWQLDAPPKSVEIHLTWSTQGKGTGDDEVVESRTFDNPQASDTRSFTLQLPEAPYSFSGQLISLIWAIELLLQPGDQCERVEFILAPDGKEVLLPRIKPA